MCHHPIGPWPRRKTTPRGEVALTLVRGGVGCKVNEREIVSCWIAERTEDRDAPALTWALQRTVQGLLQCFPPGQGKDVVWGAVRLMIGEEG